MMNHKEIVEKAAKELIDETGLANMRHILVPAKDYFLMRQEGWEGVGELCEVRVWINRIGYIYMKKE